MKLPLLAFCCFFAAAAAQAATVFKCVDAAGKITYTQQNCPANNSLDDVVRAHNPTVSGAGPAVRLAEPQRQYPPVTATTDALSASPYTVQGEAPRSRVSVVGASAPQRTCDTGLNGRDLRTAKVRGEIVPGMSRKDVESMYGDPNRNGRARGTGGSTYWNDKYLSATSVSYDTGGCVRSSYQSGHNGR